jgi:hypothetical protein
MLQRWRVLLKDGDKLLGKQDFHGVKLVGNILEAI